MTASGWLEKRVRARLDSPENCSLCAAQILIGQQLEHIRLCTAMRRNASANRRQVSQPYLHASIVLCRLPLPLG